MVTKSTVKKAATPQRLAAACITGLACLLSSQAAEAQEILMSGPLAGAPAVRKLRLYREGRVELQPAIAFSILNEYTHSGLVGATLNYNFTDWLAFGVWGGYGLLQIPTGLTDRLETLHKTRNCSQPAALESTNCALTAVNLPVTGKLSQQTGQIAWVGAPQLTITPFRGKIAMFGSLFVDTELHFMGGLAFVGLNERKECTKQGCWPSHSRTARSTITGTFGLGLTFFTHQWGGLAIDWRALPVSRNTGGFDTAGTGPNDGFPDLNIDSKDRQFVFQQLISVGYSVFLPFDNRISE